MNDDLLELLRCPADFSRLTFAEPALIDAINAQIALGEVANVAGAAVTSPLGGGLVREAGDLLYPIRNGIPTLLRDEALPLAPAEP